MHGVCDVAHADFVDEFLDEADHPEIMAVILRRYQPSLSTGENFRNEWQTTDEGILLPSRDSSAEPMKGAVITMRTTPVTDAVHPLIPVPRPPVFDHIKAAGECCELLLVILQVVDKPGLVRPVPACDLQYSSARAME